MKEDILRQLDQIQQELVATQGNLIVVQGMVQQLPDETLQPKNSTELQEALVAAKAGQTIELLPDTEYVGPFIPPDKEPDQSSIRITTKGFVPPEGRIGLDQKVGLARLRGGTEKGAFRFETTRGWQLQGLAFEANPNGEGDIIVVQGADKVWLDQIIISGNDVFGQKRGIRANGSNFRLSRSYIHNIWKQGQESQAVGLWESAGGITLVDNFLEAASVNVLFGGADARSQDLAPRDILIEGNHLYKNPAWKSISGRVIKNLLEFKTAEKIVVRNNLFENSWTDGQVGFAVAFTCRNQDGFAPWARTFDVDFSNNVIIGVQRGFSVLGHDYTHPSGQTGNVRIHHNWIEAAFDAFQAGGEVGYLEFIHNTFFNSGTAVKLYKSNVWPASENLTANRPQRFAVDNFIYRDNIAIYGAFGVFSEGSGAKGIEGIRRVTNAFEFHHSALAGAPALDFPADIIRLPVSEHDQQFSNRQLVENSVYRGKASDAGDLGK
jgi:hypothetical protein